VYRIDIEALRAKHGSGDQALVERVLREHRELIEEHDRHFGDDSPRYLPLSEALKQVVNAATRETAEPLFQYEHAVTLLVATLGQPLDQGPFNESHPHLWSDADLVLRDRLHRAGLPDDAVPPMDYLLERGPAVDVPLSPLNPLGTGYLTRQEVLEARASFQTVDLEEDRVPDDVAVAEEAVDAVRAYAGWVAEAAAANLGLFFHA
jgi:hypothetical protein